MAQVLRAADKGAKSTQANASITRLIAGCCRFFTFTQCFDLPL
jgi:hypothetical protein